MRYDSDEEARSYFREEDVERIRTFDNRALPEESPIEGGTIVMVEPVDSKKGDVAPEHASNNDEVLAKMNREELKKDLRLRGQKLSEKKMKVHN